MLFGGYSSQSVGMGKEFYDEYRIVQEYFEEASNCLGINFVKLCFASSDAQLSKIQNAYPSLFLVQTALAALLLQQGIRPTALAGYCDGEFSAFCVGGGINLPDGLYLIGKYAFLYEELLKSGAFGAQRVMGISAPELEQACQQASTEQEIVFIGIYYDQQDHLVTGHKKAIERLVTIITAQKQVRFEYAGVGLGLHSLLMKDIVKLVKMYMEKIDFKAMKIPCLSAFDGIGLVQGIELKVHLLDHIHKPLRYISLLPALQSYDVIIEIGKNSTLHHLVKQYYPEKQIFEIKKCADLCALKKALHK